MVILYRTKTHFSMVPVDGASFQWPMVPVGVFARDING